MEHFGGATRAWFESAFDHPTEVQRRGWRAIASGAHSLLIAPTGSGKTLAAFLWSVDRLAHDSAPIAAAGKARNRTTSVLYVSPLKALVYDVERNLRAPLFGIARAAQRLGLEVAVPSVAVRTGDTSARERREQLREPGDILVTTPESLYLMLGSRARENLRGVHTVVVDEVHALAHSKRGAHLALSLERLAELTPRDPQRIGLSATAQPLDEVARFVGGDREVTVVDTSEPPRLDLEIVVPVADMTNPPPPEELAPEVEDEGESLLLPRGQGARETGLWPAIYPRLVDLVREHHTSILFVNSRALCERLTRRLNEIAGEPLLRSHHGSLSHEERKQVEEQLKGGEIAGIVATSSLELGIDMGAVDLVILVESPGAVSRGLQRVGRAGHGVGQVSKGRLFPKHRGDLLEAAVVARRMREGAIEALAVPRNPLDVLAQQIVAVVSVEERTVASIESLVRRAASFRDLPRDALVGVLDMLAGRYPSHAFADLRPRLVWDRATDVLSARRGAKMLALVNGGTIPDRGMYAVYLGEDGPRLGELDEEMVNETVAGQIFTLGASSWRVERVTRDRVIVSHAPGESGKLPFWRGDGPGRPIELGRALGSFVREIDALPREQAMSRLVDDYGLDELAAVNLLDYVGEQRAATGTLPTDRALTIERFRDEMGDWRVCILTPFGARVHAPWAIALEARLGAATGFEIQTMWSDDGIVLRFADTDELPDADMLIPDPDEIEDLLVEQLGATALFAAQFRENAARSLLLPRRRPGARMPLWLQRLKSAELLAVARQFPSFPVIMETYRACVQDVFDVEALRGVLSAIRSRQIRVDVAETATPSPFAGSLVFAYVAAYLYEGDAPLAERRAQALSLDRRLLRELLGASELRELLDADVIAELEAELQRLAPDFRARHADDVHDLLRRVGDLTEGEIGDRCEGDAAAALEELVSTRRAVSMRIGGEKRFAAVEDVALYRDALDCAPPAGVAEVFLDSVERPLEVLVGRFARTHGPFRTADVARRYGIPAGQVEPALARLADRDELLGGEFHPEGVGPEWCDPRVLRSIKRRTLARLRSEVAPVETATLARFLPAWHGLGERATGTRRLQEVIVQLEGLPLPYRELEAVILPARVSDFRPEMLDELGASGWLVWVGCGSLGARDGKVALYRRERAAALIDEPAPPEELEELHRALLEHLTRRGASFFASLADACAGARTEEVIDALLDLVWAGLVTNDTFQPLRSAGAGRPRTARGRARATARLASGRWSLAAELRAGAPSATECAHARAVKLLERHGIVCREIAALEPIAGGFSATYRVLREMEEAGKVRRGYFVEGLGGAQFAFPGAVDRLRGLRSRADSREATVLSAVDPANPYGWVLPWPTRGDETSSAPRRVAGAVVVLVDGEPALYVPPRARKLVTFPAADDREVAVAAFAALERVAARRRGRYLRIDEIDGESASTSRFAEPLRAAGFRTAYRGMELESR